MTTRLFQNIAELSGVSASIVSRVFSNNSRISRKVRARVGAVAAPNDHHLRLLFRNRCIVKLLIVIIATAMLLCSSCLNTPSLPPRIVCLGDSLTACGGEGGRYSDMLQRSLPGYEIVNRGIGGDTLGGGLARLEKDVLSCAPGYVIVELGPNDYWQRRRSLQELQDDYEEIVSRCCASGARVLIISCFGNEKWPEGVIPRWNESGLSLEEYAAGLAQIEKALVEKYHCGYVPDMQCGITPKGCQELWSDSNHPNAAGNRIVADVILAELRKLL